MSIKQTPREIHDDDDDDEVSRLFSRFTYLWREQTAFSDFAETPCRPTGSRSSAFNVRSHSVFCAPPPIILWVAQISNDALNGILIHRA